MKRPRLGAKDRRALRLGALLLAPMLAYSAIIRPYRTALAEARTRAASERSLLARELALIAESRHYPAELLEAEKAIEQAAPRLFAGPDDISATGALGSYLSEAVRGSRMAVQQLETRPPEPVGEGLVALNVALRAQGDLEGVLTLLRALERSRKLVRVEAIVIERNGAQASTDDIETLTVTAAVRGYAVARADAAERTPPARLTSRKASP